AEISVFGRRAVGGGQAGIGLYATAQGRFAQLAHRAVGVVGKALAAHRHLAADLVGASMGVGLAREGGARDATAARSGAVGIAGFSSVAKEAVVAGGVVGHEEAAHRGLVAGIAGAAQAVVADDGVPCLTAHALLAGLAPVAEESVVADG